MEELIAILSDINTCIKRYDPDEEKPDLNDAVASIKLAEEKIRRMQNERAMLLNKLNELNN